MEVEKQCSCWAGAVPAEDPFPRQKPQIRMKQESDILHITALCRLFLGAAMLRFVGRFWASHLQSPHSSSAFPSGSSCSKRKVGALDVTVLGTISLGGQCEGP